MFPTDSSSVARGAALKLFRRCPICRADFSLEGLTDIGTQESIVMSHILCSKCRQGVVVFVTTQPFGVGTAMMLTDLGAVETRLTLEKDAISEDDLLGFHEILSDVGSVFPRLTLRAARPSDVI